MTLVVYLFNSERRIDLYPSRGSWLTTSHVTQTYDFVDVVRFNGFYTNRKAIVIWVSLPVVGLPLIMRGQVKNYT